MKFKIETTGKIKTPMQELIEQLEKTNYGCDEYGRGATDAIIDTINLAESMLKKERETICNAFSDAQHGAVESRWTAEEYFEETFNTKEK